MTLGNLTADLRLALRQFRRAPMFAALTVASLALGIGANSAIFSVVHAVLLRPLPYAAPARPVDDLERQHAAVRAAQSRVAGELRGFQDRAVALRRRSACIRF